MFAKSFSFFALAMGVLVFGSSASANLITNGSFETNTVAGFYGDLVYPGETRIQAWTIVNLGPASTIHLHRNYWKSYDVAGNLSAAAAAIDLDGNVGHRGAIEQIVATPAAALTLSFKLGGNYYDTPTGPRKVEVYWNGVSQGIFAHSLDLGDTIADYDWDTITLSVTGTGGLDTLRFESRTGSGWSAAIDQVELEVNAVVVPEPATVVLVAAAGLGLALKRRAW